jgi:hypothetical protein
VAPRPQYRDVRLAEGSAAGSDRLADAELVDQLVNAFLADAGAARRPDPVTRVVNGR